MVSVKGRYNGGSIVLDKMPAIDECEVIVTFLENTAVSDDGSLKFLFKDYIDDGIREPIVCFGKAVGKEQW